MDARRGIKERKLRAVSRKPPKGILANRNQWQTETDKALGILIPGMSVD